MRWLLLFACFFSLASAAKKSPPTTDFHGRLTLPPSNSPYDSGTTVTLNGGTHFAISDASGKFVFKDIGPGVYHLEVRSTVHSFPSVKIQLLEESMDQPKCNLYVYPGAEKQSVNCTSLLSLPALAKYDYFEKRQPFSIMSLFRNPMMLMMIFSGGMMYMMPKMMEGMDPEQKEQMAKQMQMQSDPSMMWNELFGGGGDDEDGSGKKSGGAAKAVKAAAGSSSGGAKKRRGKKE